MTSRPTVQCLRINQWLAEWDDLDFSQEKSRRKPEPFMYLFKMKASLLRTLSGVFRRQRHDSGVATGLQRGHDPERSKEIGRFVRYGYPWSEMSENKRADPDFSDLRKPGWLPTAIVINILPSSDERRSRFVDANDEIIVSDDQGDCHLLLPENCMQQGWRPIGLPPLEVIDGQHRLWAFDEQDIDLDFELPVVAFRGLDLSWQAYLFWTINVSPKKINSSHAFDLYPLLRTEDWLNKFEGHSIYREARAQELVDILYRQPESPWCNRINMLGEKGTKQVSQAAWVNSLLSTLMATGKGRSVKGLFGANVLGIQGPLPWTRAQQAAFLICSWKALASKISETQSPWAHFLRTVGNQSSFDLDEHDPAFAGSYSLLNQDQGVRGYLAALNDVFSNAAIDIQLSAWDLPAEVEGVTSEEISSAISSIYSQSFFHEVQEFAEAASAFDWRTSEAPGLERDLELTKKAFRGAGGYSTIRRELHRHLAEEQWWGQELSRQILRGLEEQ